jgi:hypothetical protein
MASITATEIQQEPNGQTTSSVSINNFTADLVTHRLTVNRFVRDSEDLLETTFYPGQPRAFYITNNVTPGWLRIPRESCHRFHTKVATDSRRKLPSIPRQSCH